jgi:hypothetical protein
MLQLRSRRLIRAAIAAAATLALCAGPAAAAPKDDQGSKADSGSHASQNAQDHRPAGAGTGRRIG